MFYNRKYEMKDLINRLESNKFELVILYGRRRVGKSTLVLEALGRLHKSYIYYLATEKNNLQDFKNAAGKTFPEIERLKENWDIYLEALKNRIVVIDEYPNAISEDKNIVAMFQRAIDIKLKDSKTKIVLLGSSISMMESKVLSYKSPLYGRKTSSMKLTQLNVFGASEFFKGSALKDIIEVYGFCGGVPYYLEKVKIPFWKWLEKEVLSSDTFVKTEVDFLLKYEFEDIATYKKILEAIAFGKTKLNEIKDYVRAKGEITSYIANLISVEMVEKKVPVFAGPKSKKGRYYIKDNFVRFWFKFVSPNLSMLEERKLDVLTIKKEYNTYMGVIFENMAPSFLFELMKKDKVSKFTNIGKYWGKIPGKKRGENEFDIDLVVSNSETKEIVFFEVKWVEIGKQKADAIISALKVKSTFMEWHKGDRKEKYGIIAKRIESKEILRREGYLVFDLEDLEKLMK